MSPEEPYYRFSVPLLPNTHLCRLQSQVIAGAILRAGVQVAPSRRHGRMPQRCLHQMDGSTPVKGVGGVSMAQPMGRNGYIKTGSLSRFAYNTLYSQRPQKTALFPRREHGIIEFCTLPQLGNKFPDRSGNLHRTPLASLPQYSDLASFPDGAQVSPAQLAKLTDPNPGRIQHHQECAVPAIWFEMKEAMSVGFR